jgi:hypothetical protein
MSPQDLTAIAVLTVALADLDPCQHFEDLEGERDDKDIQRIREAGRAIMKAKAAMTFNYFYELKQAGFSEPMALELTKKFKPEMEFKV